MMAKPQRFTIAKYEGDDAYSWALFEYGRPRYTGMSRSEAQWRRDTARKQGAVA
jgi:hypothetical protein